MTPRRYPGFSTGFFFKHGGFIRGLLMGSLFALLEFHIRPSLHAPDSTNEMWMHCGQAALRAKANPKPRPQDIAGHARFCDQVSRSMTC